MVNGMAKVTQSAQKDRQYWLLKSDPDTFGFDDLWKAPNRTTHWDGVRNFQARNYMRDEMKRGDLAFFYHSGGDEPAILGIVEIVREGYPDPTALDSGLCSRSSPVSLGRFCRCRHHLHRQRSHAGAGRRAIA